MLLQQANNLRDFGKTIYVSFPHRMRDQDEGYVDVSGHGEMPFFKRFCYVFGNMYADYQDKYRAILDWFDPYVCPDDILKYLSMNYGFPMRADFDYDFQRLLIKNLRLIYQSAGRITKLPYIIFMHTGISVKIFHVNERPGTVTLNKHTYLTADYDPGDLTLHVDDASGFQEYEKIKVSHYGEVSYGIISSVDSSTNIITLSGELSHDFPENSLVVRDNYLQFGHAKFGKRGFDGFILGSSYLGFQRIHNNLR